jgi:hypothetical protein
MPTAIPATAKAGLITCEFTRTEPDGASTVLIDSFQGNRLKTSSNPSTRSMTSARRRGSISSAISVRCVRLEPTMGALNSRPSTLVTSRGRPCSASVGRSALLTLGPLSGQSLRRRRPDAGFKDHEKQLCVLLQRFEPRLEPNLRDESGHHSTADYGRQQDGVLSLIDDVIGQPKQCRDRTEG